jgi:hypothetical protein
VKITRPTPAAAKACAFAKVTADGLAGQGEARLRILQNIVEKLIRARALRI